MKRALFVGAAMLLAVAPAAFADSKPIVAGAGLSPNITPSPVAAPATATPAAATTTTGMGPGSPAEAAAAATGSDTGVTPGTPAGEPSTIPHSTTTATTGNTTTGDTTPPAAGKTAPTDGGTLFTSIRPKDDLSSSVIGLDIFNGANQDIGTIKDIAFGVGGVKAYIVGVGGFLGMGDRFVAVRPSALTLSYDAGAKKWHAVMDTNAADLKAAPEFKYPS
jgi:hypothetical protein